MTVRHGQVDYLRDQVDVLRSVITQRVHVVVLEHVQHQDKPWPLRPGIGGIDIVAAIVCVQRFVPRSFVAGHVLIRHLAVNVFGEKPADSARRFAFVKRVACCLNALRSRSTGRESLSLGIDHVANQFAEVSVEDETAQSLPTLAILQPIFCVVGPAFGAFLAAVHRIFESVVQVKAVLGNVDRVLGYVFETLGPVSVESGQPYVHVGRDDHRMRSVLSMREVILQGRRSGRCPCPDPGDDTVLLGTVEYQRGDTGPASDIHRRRFHGHGSRHPDVKRVTALLEFLDANHRRRVVAGSDHAVSPEDVGAHRLDIVLVIDGDVSIERFDQTYGSAKVLPQLLDNACSDGHNGDAGNQRGHGLLVAHRTNSLS